jgi:hypothetical protein
MDVDRDPQLAARELSVILRNIVLSIDALLALVEDVDQYDSNPIDSAVVTDQLEALRTLLTALSLTNQHGVRRVEYRVTGETRSGLIRRLRDVRNMARDAMDRMSSLRVESMQSVIRDMQLKYEELVEQFGLALANYAAQLPQQRDPLAMGQHDPLTSRLGSRGQLLATLGSTELNMGEDNAPGAFERLLDRLGKMALPDDVLRLISLYSRPVGQEPEVPFKYRVPDQELAALADPASASPHRFLSAFGLDNSVYRINPRDPELTLVHFVPTRQPQPDPAVEAKAARRAAIARGAAIIPPKRSKLLPPRPSEFYREEVVMTLRVPHGTTEYNVDTGLDQLRYSVPTDGRLMRMWMVEGQRMYTAFLANPRQVNNNRWVPNADPRDLGRYVLDEVGDWVRMDLWSVDTAPGPSDFQEKNYNDGTRHLAHFIIGREMRPFAPRPLFHYGPAGNYPASEWSTYGSVEVNQLGEVYVVAKPRGDAYDDNYLIRRYYQYDIYDVSASRAQVAIRTGQHKARFTLAA